MKANNFKIFALLFLLIGFSSVNIYAQNFDFEEWEVNSDSTVLPKHWTAGWSLEEEKTTDAYSRDYAIRIYRWYMVVIGRAILGKLPENTWGEYNIINSGLPVNGKPTKLSGYYKYTDVYPGDSAEVIVILKKYNTTLNKIDTIAYGRTTLDSADTYTPFSVDIQELIPDVQPDSIIIGIYSGMPLFYAENCSNCNYLYMDALSLEGGSIVLANNINERKKASVNIYPNPFSESTIINIEGFEHIGNNCTFTLYNLLGEKTRTMSVKSPTFEIQKENLQSGVYFYQVNNGSQIIFNGKIAVR